MERTGIRRLKEAEMGRGGGRRRGGIIREMGIKKGYEKNDRRRLKNET